jgi:uncharacterized protein (DUF1697 family)
VNSPKHLRSASLVKRAKAPTAQATPLVALLRGVNVGGHKKVPMAELRDLAARLGLLRVETYIQSGNLVFLTKLTAPAVENALERAIEQNFGFTVEVVVRSAAQWLLYAAASPFPDAQAARPNHLLLGLSKRPVKAGAAAALRPYTTAGERIAVLEDAIWIDYANAMASSKLSPAVLDRCVGSTVTARNWRTLQKLAEMLQSLGSGKFP